MPLFAQGDHVDRLLQARALCRVRLARSARPPDGGEEYFRPSQKFSTLR